MLLHCKDAIVYRLQKVDHFIETLESLSKLFSNPLVTSSTRRTEGLIVKIEL